MPDILKQIDRAMLQLQALLDVAELDEHYRVQSAFNALACAIDEELVKD